MASSDLRLQAALPSQCHLDFSGATGFKCRAVKVLLDLVLLLVLLMYSSIFTIIMVSGVLKDTTACTTHWHWS